MLQYMLGLYWPWFELQKKFLSTKVDDLYLLVAFPPTFFLCLLENENRHLLVMDNQV